MAILKKKILRRKKIDQNTIIKYGVLAGLTQSLFTVAIVFIIINIGSYFEARSTEFDFLGPVLMLIIFVFSATVSGLIILGAPGYLAMQKKIHEAALTLLVSLATLFLFGVLIFLILINI